MLSFIPFSFLNVPIIPETASGMDKFLFGILLISIILLWCFISITGYFLTLYLINYTDIANKYPKYIKIINFFKNINIIYIIIEIIFIIIILVSTIIMCINLIYFN